MLAKYKQKTVPVLGLIFSLFFCTVEVRARTIMFMELDVDWQALYFGGEIPNASWGGLNPQRDEWQVVIEFETFSLQTAQAIFERSHPDTPPFSIKVYSSSALPVGTYPADGHSLLLSDDVAVKQNYSQDIQRYGHVALDDYLRGVSDDGTGEGWYFRRRIANFLDGNSTPDSAQIVDALNMVGRELFVSEEFSLRPVGSHLKYGRAIVRDVQVLNLAAAAMLECRYELEVDWGTGFTANLFLKNEGAEVLSTWMLALNFDDAVSINHFWSGEVFSEEGSAHIRNMEWNAVIEPGQEISLGINGSKTPAQSANALLRSVVCR